MSKRIYAYSPNTVAATATEPESIAFRPQRVATITAASGRSVRVLVILDTGADSCAFPMGAALLLGLDVLALPKAFTGGVGSQANLTVYETVTINLGDGIAFQTRVGFTSGLEAMGVGLLGQKGFFEKYNVEFRHAERVFTIDPV